LPSAAERQYRYLDLDSMCQLVTIGIDKAFGSALPEFGNAREGFAVNLSRNPTLAKIFPPNDLRLEITVGGCSCGLFTTRATDAEVIDREQLDRRRYKRQGWSSAKIERAIQASRAAQSRDQRGENAHRFRDAILAVLERTPSVRIFAHMYRGSFETEPVLSKGRAALTRAAYRANHGAIPEDVLVEVAG
jgi:hypothetical protein